jgi:RNA polymerase sigma factor (sigma-70 family)
VDLTTVKAYLFTITRNLYLEELRSARGRIERGAQRPEQAAVEIADPAPSPARVAMARRELEDTLADLQVLSESDRAALLLRADDLSYEEIAAALGIAPGAARVRVHRARLKLAQERDRRLEEANGGRLGIPMKEARR